MMQMAHNIPPVSLQNITPWLGPGPLLNWLQNLPYVSAVLAQSIPEVSSMGFRIQKLSMVHASQRP